mmetsp:Transcript_41309/g.134030  ORF Transcript_41309/g.134030 Transcript_41309/m.134030 type:complete len:252 (-) Transcript_41309:213-968(-)
MFSVSESATWSASRASRSASPEPATCPLSDRRTTSKRGWARRSSLPRWTAARHPQRRRRWPATLECSTIAARQSRARPASAIPRSQSAGPSLRRRLQSNRARQPARTRLLPSARTRRRSSPVPARRQMASPPLRRRGRSVLWSHQRSLLQLQSKALVARSSPPPLPADRSRSRSLGPPARSLRWFEASVTTVLGLTMAWHVAFRLLRSSPCRWPAPLFLPRGKGSARSYCALSEGCGRRRATSTSTQPRVR